METEIACIPEGGERWQGSVLLQRQCRSVSLSSTFLNPVRNMIFGEKIFRWKTPDGGYEKVEVKCDAATRAWTVGDKMLEAPLACMPADKVGKKDVDSVKKDEEDGSKDSGGSNCEKFHP